MNGDIRRVVGVTVGIVTAFFAIALFATLIAVAFQVGGSVAHEVMGVPPGTMGAYGPHYGWGFPLFGILFWVLALFLVFGVFRAAFGGRRWRDGGPWMDRRTMAEEWHRQMHTDLERRDADRRDTGTPRPGA